MDNDYLLMGNISGLSFSWSMPAVPKFVDYTKYAKYVPGDIA